MIRFEHVYKKYDDGTTAVQNFSLTVHKGELLTLIGPSGCGKTTTMRMINRLVKPTQGKILIDGTDQSEIDPVELRRNIGYVIQRIGLFPHMTVEQNISLVPRLKKWEPEKYTKRVSELMELVGLDPSTFKDRYPSELSGGQQQRIGVIRALAAEPEILLMDEPFSALDPISREHLQDDIIHLQDELRKTIVFVTHDMDEAIKIATRIALMRDGQLVQVDTPDRILRHPADDFVRGFIGEDRLNIDVSAGPIAADLMFTSVVTSSPRRGLAEALRLMRSGRVDSLFITDQRKTFLGVVSLEDVKEHYPKETKNVSEIMNTQVKTLNLKDPVGQVAEIFHSQNGTRAIPVLDGDKLAGIITRSSMMRGLADWKHTDT